MSDDDRKPDDAPADRADVIKFLDWYAARVSLRRYQGWQEPYVNAFVGKGDGKQATVGDLRNGARRIAALFKPPEMSPHDLWCLCKSKRAPEVDAKWKQLRAKFKGE